MKKIRFKNKRYQSLPMSINNISLTHNTEANLSNSLFVDFFYPIGTYYTTRNTSFDPNVTWGGTWELEIIGQFHVSASKTGSYRVSGALTNTSDGGYAAQVLVSHTHTAPACGDHTHHVAEKLVDNYKGGGSWDAAYTWTYNTNYVWSSTDGAHSHSYGQPVESYTSIGTNSNYPSYRGVKRWHRIA